MFYPHLPVEDTRKEVSLIQQLFFEPLKHYDRPQGDKDPDSQGLILYLERSGYTLIPANEHCRQSLPLAHCVTLTTVRKTCYTESGLLVVTARLHESIV